jgi:hypothetical protein
MLGRDPFDGLRGQRVPGFLRRSARGRQAVIQVRKRIPFDLAPLYGVSPFRMAKADAAFLTAAARLLVADRIGREEFDRTSGELVEGLLGGEGHTGDGSWGYEFDVQTRWAFYSAGSPNAIVTVFVGRALLCAGTSVGHLAWMDEGGLTASFVRRELLRRSGSGTYVAYVPGTDRVVYNASALGAGLLASAGAIRGDEDLVSEALECAEAVIQAQRPDGSWPYGEGGDLSWSDNFHTAFTIDGLLQIWLATHDRTVRAALDIAVDNWVRTFFDPDGGPRYYPHKAYPYDIHSAATAVDVAARLATHGWETAGLARQVHRWTLRSLVDPLSGVTWFQKHRFFVDTRNFVRWGEAHWALATSSLALLEAGTCDPLETAVATARDAEV